jgi:hypothetical protein
MEKNKKYVILRHLTMPDKGKCFFTTNDPNEPEEEKGLSFEGERWYEVVGYSNTIPGAQKMCDENYGGLPRQEEFDEWARKEIEKRTENYINKTLNK